MKSAFGFARGSLGLGLRELYGAMKFYDVSVRFCHSGGLQSSSSPNPKPQSPTPSVCSPLGFRVRGYKSQTLNPETPLTTHPAKLWGSRASGFSGFRAGFTDSGASKLQSFGRVELCLFGRRLLNPSSNP